MNNSFKRGVCCFKATLQINELHLWITLWITRATPRSRLGAGKRSGEGAARRHGPVMRPRAKAATVTGRPRAHGRVGRVVSEYFTHVTY